MRNSIFFVLFIALLNAWSANAEVQLPNLSAPINDSASDTTPHNSFWKSTSSVALRSAILPGWGQVSNRQLWKVPLFYAALGACAYIIKDNHTQYKRYQLAYRQRIDTSHSLGIDEFDPSPLNTNPAPEGYVYAANGLLSLREQYRRWRDLTYIVGFGVYAANILDAYVYSELKDFDVSENLSMRLKPVNFVNIAGTNCIVSTINFRFK